MRSIDIVDIIWGLFFAGIFISIIRIIRDGIKGRGTSRLRDFLLSIVSFILSIGFLIIATAIENHKNKTVRYSFYETLHNLVGGFSTIIMFFFIMVALYELLKCTFCEDTDRPFK